MKNDFQSKGYAVIRGLLNPQECRFYREEIVRLSGVSDNDFGSRVFECPDGVSQHKLFWPIISNDHLINVLHEILGPDIRYTQHSDLHAHRTGGWHRDCACREFGNGPDWQDKDDPYKVVRVAIYLQSFRESGSSLGVVPGSHHSEARANRYVQRFWAMLFSVGHKILKLASKLGFCEKPTRLKKQMIIWTQGDQPSLLQPPTRPEWIETEPGDCIIFDQRIYHSASPIHGPKYAIYLSYSPENQHARNHMGYYRHFRKDLAYEDLDSDLAEQLQEKHLFMRAPPPDSVHGYFSNQSS
jgi:hypothetical protein